jgi:hypothetical protein
VTREITIRVKLPEAGAVGSLDEAEEVAFGAARETFRQVLQELGEGAQGEVGACSRCGALGANRKGRRGRRLYTRMGEVALSQRRARCGSCGHVFSPLGGALGSSGGDVVDATGA